MNFKLIILAVILATTSVVQAQLPYSTIQYPVREELGIKYDSALNYCNRLQVLQLNLYKPTGDFNIERPVIIFVHGGAFTSTDNENEPTMVQMAKNFASRGYVAATIHYREGLHLYNYPTGDPWGINIASYARLYTVDPDEVIRTGYRAQQDLKSAIRFLKGRTAQDSSAACKFFVGGHSAGAITVLTAAFLDLDSEKPLSVSAISTVPDPQWTNAWWQDFGSGPQGYDDNAYRNQNPAPFDYNAPSCYLRPDLGGIDGAGNLNGSDLKIIGVASMAGAISDMNLLAGPNKPAVFLSQQEQDPVVPFNADKPFGIAAFGMSISPNERWPVVYGSNYIYNQLQGSNYPAAYKKEFSIGLSHDIFPSIPVVADSISQFFSRVLDTSTACFKVLPLTTSFAASRQGSQSLLSWVIYNRGSLQSVEVQRSADGRTWATLKINQVTADGNFSFYDLNPLQLNYYRLKEINANGSINYSEIKVVSFISLAASQVYPNPAREVISLQPVFDGSEKRIVVNLYSLQGQLLKTAVATSNGILVRMETTNLANGIYVCKLIHESRIETIQVTVAK